MDVGMMVTVVLVLLITVAFGASAKHVIKKFASGHCCGAGSCSACGGGCSSGKEH